MVNDSHWYDMWDKGVVEDGYVNLWCNVSDRTVPPGDGCAENSGITYKRDSTPSRVRSSSVTCINYANSPVRLDPEMFSTPKKKFKCITSPDLVRRSPRLLKKSVDAVTMINGSKKRLFENVDEYVNVDDDDYDNVVFSAETRQAELEYENIQLVNDAEDACHPIDDPRSPVSDTEEMGIGVYCEFVNNYFEDHQWVDTLHPQHYMNAVTEVQASGVEQEGEKEDPKGKAIVPYDTEGNMDYNSDDHSSSSESDGEGVTEVQGPNECGNEPTHQKLHPWYNQFEQVHGEDVDADGNGELFPDADGNTLLMVDVDTIFLGMQFMDKDDFKKHLRGYYAIKKRFQYKLKPNDNERIKVICRFNKSQDCKFFIWASVKPGEPTKKVTFSATQ
ncbi:uncharacterized protein LOC113318267 [Papaver somniferum]|nr:uncharacterized protein LOC113318267 [Papaver somniferum]XP_026422202.1 uncharacterized protein LOC113318267 [Papaver somniferum]